MSKLVVLGDTHFRIDEPFFSAQQKFMKWFSEQDFNTEDNIFIQLGDFYHDAKPNPRVYQATTNWLSTKIKCNRKFIISGNRMHEYNKLQNSYAIDPLIEFADVIKDISTPIDKEFSIYDTHCMFLPYEHNGLTEKYNELFKTDLSACDFIFGHFANDALYDSEFVDTSNYKGNLVLGHIHKRYGNYLGTPYATRYDERNKESFIMLIDVKTKEIEYVKVPVFIDYEDVCYPDNLDEKIVNERIWTIKKAPSIKVAESYYKCMYPNMVIRSIETDGKESIRVLSERIKKDKKNSIREFFSMFKTEKKLSKDVSEIVEKYLLDVEV